MIDQQISTYISSKKRLGFEHRSSLYVTNMSCDKLIDPETNFTIPYGMCTRAAYYSCVGVGEVSKEPDTKREISRKLGDYTEYMLLKIFESNGTLEEKAVKFTIDKYCISGKLDAILTIDEEKCGLEIKSISSNRWTNNEIFGSKWNLPAPKIEHLIQCMVYLYAYIGELDTFYLVYIRRDNGDIKEFKIQLVLIDDILYPSIDGVVNYSINCNNILSRAEKLKNFIDTDSLPPRDYKPVYEDWYAKLLVKHNLMPRSRYEKYLECAFGDFNCLGCGFRDLCLSEKG